MRSRECSMPASTASSATGRTWCARKWSAAAWRGRSRRRCSPSGSAAENAAADRRADLGEAEEAVGVAVDQVEIVAQRRVGEGLAERELAVPVGVELLERQGVRP